MSEPHRHHADEPTHAERAADFATENRIYRVLEGTVFKGIIGYTVHPLHICALLVLWMGLLAWHNTVFELVGGNYTNGLSAMAASIVLLQQTRHHREVKRLHREHRQVLAELREHLHGLRSGGT
jgi:hypothetical protein